MNAPVPVRVGDCACPNTPHDEGDFVYLDPVASLELGAAAEVDVRMVQELPEKRRTPALIARWAVTYVTYGAVGWNWTELDDKGRVVPRPFDVDVLTSDFSKSRLVAEKADELYSEAVTGPLVARAMEAQRSLDGPTETPVSISHASRKTQKKSESSSPLASAGQP